MQKVGKSVFGVFTALVLTAFLAGSAGARSLVDPPTVTAVTPDHGPIGEKVTITGTNLTGAMVEFNGDGQRVAATNVLVDATGSSLTVNVPPDTPTGAHPIAITTPGGTILTTINFTVAPQAAGPAPVMPGITFFAPTTGKVGTKVAIHGPNLAGTQWVKFGSLKATFVISKGTLVTATVPNNAKSGNVSLKTSTGVVTSSRFTVIQSPSWSAKLTVAQEVPKQVVKNGAATGSFTATLTGTKLTYKLTFSKLTGPATAAHIHIGAKGKAGAVVVPLCAPCTSPVTGSATIKAGLRQNHDNHLLYVNVHTAKNPNGEIRGQLGG